MFVTSQKSARTFALKIIFGVQVVVYVVSCVRIDYAARVNNIVTAYRHM